MDLSTPNSNSFNLKRVPQKGKSRLRGGRKARNNRSGEKGGNFISTPGDQSPAGLGDVYKDNSPKNLTRNKSYRAPSPDNGSDSSRFSKDCNPSDDEKQKRKQKQEQNTQKKRQNQKNKLAESQRQKDAESEPQRHHRNAEPECINLEHDDNDSTTGARYKDGEGYEAGVAENVKSGRNRHKFRGNNHQRSAIEGSLSPSKRRGGRMLKSDCFPNHGRSNRRERGDGGTERRGLTSYSGDPLDEAQSQQETNRSRRSPTAVSSNRNRKVVEDVTDSPQKDANRKRRGKCNPTKAMSANIDLWGKGKMTSNRHRKKRAEDGKRENPASAVLILQTANEDNDYPSSGEKRKSKDFQERREEKYFSKKKQYSPKGSQEHAINVDDSVMDQSILSVGSAPGRDINDGDDVDINGTLEACEKFVDVDDHKQSSTDAAFTGWDDEGTMAMMNVSNPKESSRSSGRKTRNKCESEMQITLAKHCKSVGSHAFALLASTTTSICSATKKKIGDIHGHLKGTNKSDNLVDACSPNSKADLRKKGGLSSANIYEKPTPRKDDRWLTSDRASSHVTERSYGSTSGTSKSKQSKLKSPGHLFNRESEKKLGFLGGTPKQNKQKANKNSTKARRKSSSNNSITQYTKRQTRKSSRAKESKNEVITIDDSSSEEDESSNDVSHEYAEESVAQGRGKRTVQAVGDRHTLDAVRIAIGQKVVKTKCQLSMQLGTNHPYIMFAFWENDKQSEHSVYLQQDELKEIKYYVAGDDDTAVSSDVDDSMTVISFRITPSSKNSFDKYKCYYDQDDNEASDDTGKHYISVEVRDTDEFQTFLFLMREHKQLGVWCTEEAEIQSYELEKYTKALLEDSAKEKKKRRSARRTRSGGDKKKEDSDNKLLLVYPFDADEATLAKASSGLIELGGDLLKVDNAGQLLDAEMYEQSAGGEGNGVKGRSSRTHYVTIQQDDKDRLCPGQFLNDALVDFWMRWISQGESKKPNSSVHFFTSHFMTTLKNDGPEAVASWTKKKNINIFEKKLIFIPVNADLHWSLCVVVNPGLIVNNHNDDVPFSEEHACAVYAMHIRKWLNFEWKRLGNGKIKRLNNPFGKERMHLVSPRIPYQENGCDCGVFVCRYAYNLYIMRHQEFTYSGYQDKFKSLITKGPAFDFGMHDIALIREEIGLLIDRLSVFYVQMKEQEKANKRVKNRKREITLSGEQHELSRNHSEDLTSNVARRKEDTTSATTKVASDEEGVTYDGTATGADVEQDESSENGIEVKGAGSGKEVVSIETTTTAEYAVLPPNNGDGDSMMVLSEEEEELPGTTVVNEDDGATTESAATGAAVDWDGDTLMRPFEENWCNASVQADDDVTMLTSDEKENISMHFGSQNSVHEVAVPEERISAPQGGDGDDGPDIESHTI